MTLFSTYNATENLVPALKTNQITFAEIKGAMVFSIMTLWGTTFNRIQCYGLLRVLQMQIYVKLGFITFCLMSFIR
jgi:hypothetical protein